MKRFGVKDEERCATRNRIRCNRFQFVLIRTDCRERDGVTDRANAKNQRGIRPIGTSGLSDRGRTSSRRHEEGIAPGDDELPEEPSIIVINSARIAVPGINPELQAVSSR